MYIPKELLFCLSLLICAYQIKTLDLIAMERDVRIHEKDIKFFYVRYYKSADNLSSLVFMNNMTAYDQVIQGHACTLLNATFFKVKHLLNCTTGNYTFNNTCFEKCGMEFDINECVDNKMCPEEPVDTVKCVASEDSPSGLVTLRNISFDVPCFAPNGLNNTKVGLVTEPYDELALVTVNDTINNFTICVPIEYQELMGFAVCMAIGKTYLLSTSSGYFDNTSIIGINTSCFDTTMCGPRPIWECYGSALYCPKDDVLEVVCIEKEVQENATQMFDPCIIANYSTMNLTFLMEDGKFWYSNAYYDYYGHKVTADFDWKTKNEYRSFNFETNETKPDIAFTADPFCSLLGYEGAGANKYPDPYDNRDHHRWTFNTTCFEECKNQSILNLTDCVALGTNYSTEVVTMSCKHKSVPQPIVNNTWQCPNFSDSQFSLNRSLLTVTSQGRDWKTCTDKNILYRVACAACAWMGYEGVEYVTQTYYRPFMHRVVQITDSCLNKTNVNLTECLELPENCTEKSVIALKCTGTPGPSKNITKVCPLNYTIPHRHRNHSHHHAHRNTTNRGNHTYRKPE